MLVVIINFFSLYFTSIEIEGKRVNSSQNERTLGAEGKGYLKTRKGEQVNKEGQGSKLGSLERTYFLNVLKHSATFFCSLKI